MIDHFPVVLLIPGLLFIAAGFFYFSRASSMDDADELGKRMRKANRSTGNLSILFGVVLLVIAVPLGVVIAQLH
jgi:hypothetical protein